VQCVLKLSLSAACLLLGHTAAGQNYPTRPLRVIVPFPAGGSIDIISRSITQRWSAYLGRQSVIDNRGGAGVASERSSSRRLRRMAIQFCM
jgi:tripartite-type tricarboxylate transporter receptor subunit TctC